jgi:hypothetical protein
MRFVTVLVGVVALTGTAFAGDIALGASVTGSCGTSTAACFLTGYGYSNVLDGYSNSTLWVAPGGNGVGTYEPTLTVDLGGVYTGVDSVSISGWGNVGAKIIYDVFVGTSTSEGSDTEIATNITQMGNGNYPTILGQWTNSYSVSTALPVRYVIYDVVGSQMDSNGHTVAGGYDDAYASEIKVDDPVVPEPGTFGLLGAGLLALGFAWRSRK